VDLTQGGAAEGAVQGAPHGLAVENHDLAGELLVQSPAEQALQALIA